jgi:hypothetical protein
MFMQWPSVGSAVAQVIVAYTVSGNAIHRPSATPFLFGERFELSASALRRMVARHSLGSAHRNRAYIGAKPSRSRQHRCSVFVSRFVQIRF